MFLSSLNDKQLSCIFLQGYIKKNILAQSKLSFNTFSTDDSCFLDTTIRIWDLSTGKQVRTMSGHETTVSCRVAFGQLGQWVA